MADLRPKTSEAGAPVEPLAGADADSLERPQPQPVVPAVAPASPQPTAKDPLERLFTRIQILGIVVAAIVGLATLSKSAIDAHAAALKDTREQISTAENFYYTAVDRALKMTSTPSQAPSSALLAAAFDNVVRRGPIAFDTPLFSDQLAAEG